MERGRNISTFRKNGIRCPQDSYRESRYKKRIYISLSAILFFRYLHLNPLVEGKKKPFSFIRYFPLNQLKSAFY